MAADEANTPVRRLYFAIQAAYVGSLEERPRALDTACQIIAVCRHAAPTSFVRTTLDRILHLIVSDKCYPALKLVRQLIHQEHNLLAKSHATLASGQGKAEPESLAPSSHEMLAS